MRAGIRFRERLRPFLIAGSVLAILSVALPSLAKDPWPHLSRSFAAEKRGDLAASIQHMTKALEVGSSDKKMMALLYSRRGQAYQNLRRFDEALKDYKSALDYDRTNYPLLINSGWVLVQQKKYERALVFYDAAAKSKPEEATTYFNRAIALKELKRFRDAYADLKKVSSLAPRMKNLRIIRSEVLVGMKRYDEALGELNFLIDFQPNDVGLLLLRGRSFEGLRNFEAALRDFEKVVSLAPRSQNAFADYMDISNLERDRKNFDAAVTAVSKAISLVPSAWLYLARANIHKLAGNPALALNDAEKVLEIDPGVALAYEERAYALLHLRRLDEALLSVNQALAKGVPSHATRGKIYEMMGQFDKARADYEASIRLTPGPKSYMLERIKSLDTPFKKDRPVPR